LNEVGAGLAPGYRKRSQISAWLAERGFHVMAADFSDRAGPPPVGGSFEPPDDPDGELYITVGIVCGERTIDLLRPLCARWTVRRRARPLTPLRQKA
jgi:hypothetical protein